MKKLIIALLAIAPAVFASPQQELSMRLSKVKGFSAGFEQIVTDPDNRIINRGEGTLAIKRPNLFRWHAEQPDENVLVSDGRTLWHHSPYLDQVTAMWMEQAASHTPFVLLTRNNSSDWQNYTVTQQGNHFILVPKTTSNMKQFTVDVMPDGRITRFHVEELDGQASRFIFNNIKLAMPASSLFKFTVPKGVELDDQRQP